MALDRCGFLALPFLGWLLVELAAAKFSQDACLLTGTLEATQGSVKILIFLNADTRHTNYCLWLRYKETRHKAGTELHMISAEPGFCKAKTPIFNGKGVPLRYDAPPMLVLGLETSCDETGVALFDTERGLIGQALHSQVDLHADYGGVVPEIASRDHIRALLPLMQGVLNEAGIERPDAIAYTAGPGLVGALMVGGGLAGGLGLAWNCPVIPVHHMEAHLLVPMLEDDAPAFPFLALLVSGGHTMLVSVQALGEYKVLGSTLDDAVGEAFDKTAKLLGLPYPGGPALAALARQGNDEALELPRPMLNREGFDFSFSGLKTAVMLQVRKAEAAGNLDAVRADIAASFERAVVDSLVGRTLKAAQSEQAERIVVAGGVSANTVLRESLSEKFKGRVFYPRHEYCTDNGAMIAFAGAMRLADAQKPATIQALARWSLDSLAPPNSE